MATYSALDRVELSEILDLVDRGEEVTITRDGKPVAQVVPARSGKKPVLGTWAGRVILKPGWDEPITEEELLGDS
jgi:prevent-host-death family protein